MPCTSLFKKVRLANRNGAYQGKYARLCQASRVRSGEDRIIVIQCAASYELPSPTCQNSTSPAASWEARCRLWSFWNNEDIDRTCGL